MAGLLMEYKDYLKTNDWHKKRLEKLCRNGGTKKKALNITKFNMFSDPCQYRGGVSQGSTGDQTTDRPTMMLNFLN